MPFQTFAFAGMLMLGSAVLADHEEPLANWPSPPYWAPPPAHHARAALAVSTPLPFIALPPCRIIDTRGNAPLTGGFLPPATVRSYTVTNVCGIPAGAQALSLNATVVHPTGPGFLTLYPEGGTFPPVSTLNYLGNDVIVNAAVVPLSGTGGISMALGVSGGDVILDTNGYYAPQTVVSTLNGVSGAVTLAAGSNVTITPSGQTLTIASAGAPGSTGPPGPPGPPGSNGWALTGNAGTTAANFLGTTDNVPLELRINGQRGLRLEQMTAVTAQGTWVGANVVAGSSLNSVTAGVTMATIAGGGGTAGVLAYPNSVTDVGGTVGGGYGNRAGTVNGSLFEYFATVGGGAFNRAGGAYSSVGGGYGNAADALASTVAGGNQNAAGGAWSTVPGGNSNAAGGDKSFAAGNRARVRTPAAVGNGTGDQGTFVWADAQNADFESTGNNQFLIRSAGGVGVNTNAPQGELQLGNATDSTAFRFGSTAARHHLISNRDMVFNAYSSPSDLGSPLFIWRRSPSQFDETSFANLMFLTSTGDLTVTGSLSKGGGSFKIDHPLDPENRYLYHSFVESPDMKNIYDGVVATDAKGYATVELPEWFEALNRDFRYQLTVLDESDGDSFVQAKIVKGVSSKRFSLRTSAPHVQVSWQVTGIRRDAWAENHRIPVEEAKPESERGRFLHPREHGRPPEDAITSPGSGAIGLAP